LVFDRQGVTFEAPTRQVFADEWARRSVIVTTPEKADLVPPSWLESGVQVWKIDDTNEVLARLQTEGLSGLYLEGGPKLWAEFLKAEAIDYLFSYQAPKLLADATGRQAWSGLTTPSMEDALVLEEPRFENFGRDRLTRGFLTYPK
jgi:diaminohydroxyphosphoribosylaminopyrimidine deaminase/5-amino-6-(5-phosphoribosylamino)uracil reductase